MIEWIGLMAGAITTVGFAPQVIRSWRTRHVADLSIWQPVVLLGGMMAWLVYGIFRDSLAIILTNIFSILLNLVLVYLKIRYRHNVEEHA